VLPPHIKRKKCKKKAYILPHRIVTMQRKEEGRRFSTKGLGLAGRI
jgi:hypothetical protein